MDRASIKERSKQLLQKNHWLCVGVAFLGSLVLGGGPSFNFNYSTTTDEPIYGTNPFEQMPEITPALIIGIVVGIIISTIISYITRVFVTNQLMVGSSRFFLKYRKNNPADIGELFQSYKDKTFLNVAKVTFLRDLYIGLWTLLFIVPGIIKSYEYWAVNYILAVKPDTEYSKALDLSKKMMDGHKMDVFVMALSFAGWHFLTVFTCGILGICYVAPYQRIAFTELYCEIREDALRRGIISPYDVPDYADYVPQSAYYPYYNTGIPSQGYVYPPQNTPNQWADPYIAQANNTTIQPINNAEPSPDSTSVNDNTEQGQSAPFTDTETP